MRKKTYDELQFRDDFLFCKILTKRPDIAKELLELILGIKINRVEVHKQEEIEITSNGKGVRLDVYAEDDNNSVYDIEMQTIKKKDLPKRSRYYQGMIDLNLIERGAKYSQLKRSYVIFICMKDPFSAGRHIYTFENVCIESPEIKLGDETRKVFLNAAGKVDDVSKELLEFFKLLRTGQGNSRLTKDIVNEVEKARNQDEWRLEYMTWNLLEQDAHEEGMEEGIKKGLAKGQKTMASSIKSLMQKLGYTVTEAMDVLSIPDDEREQLRAMIK